MNARPLRATLSREHRKLDGYAAIVIEIMARAEVRKAEAKRMQELAASDENRARLLKDTLKLFLELHELKQVQSFQYKLNLTKNKEKQPLIIKDGISERYNSGIKRSQSTEH